MEALLKGTRNAELYAYILEQTIKQTQREDEQHTAAKESK